MGHGRLAGGVTRTEGSPLRPPPLGQRAGWKHRVPGSPCHGPALREETPRRVGTRVKHLSRPAPRSAAKGTARTLLPSPRPLPSDNKSRRKEVLRASQITLGRMPLRVQAV